MRALGNDMSHRMITAAIAAVILGPIFGYSVYSSPFAGVYLLGFACLFCPLVVSLIANKKIILLALLPNPLLILTWLIVDEVQHPDLEHLGPKQSQQFSCLRCPRCWFPYRSNSLGNSYASGPSAGRGEAVARRSRTSQLDAIFLQFAPQLRRITKMNCGHSQFAWAFQIHFAIVDENAFSRFALGYLQCRAIDRLIRFS